MKIILSKWVEFEMIPKASGIYYLHYTFESDGKCTAVLTDKKKEAKQFADEKEAHEFLDQNKFTGYTITPHETATHS